MYIVSNRLTPLQESCLNHQWMNKRRVVVKRTIDDSDWVSKWIVYRQTLALICQQSRDVIGSQSITPDYYCSSSGEFDPIRRFTDSQRVQLSSFDQSVCCWFCLGSQLWQLWQLRGTQREHSSQPLKNSSISSPGLFPSSLFTFFTGNDPGEEVEKWHCWTYFSI